MRPLVSVCIPVYNREEYLASTIESIINQSFEDGDIEIVISDNASTDGTKEIAETYVSRYSYVNFVELEKNEGADLNYMNVVANASGEYCWLFGSDDIMEPGALKIILDKIKSTQSDIYLCSEYIGDLQARHISTHHLLSIGRDETYFFSSVDEMGDYFGVANSQSALFGYLTSIIVAKDRWSEIILDESYIGTLYSHMYVLYSIIENGASLSYIDRPLVTWRGGNDSFGGKGRITERYLVDINGFAKIADRFICNSEVLSKFKRVFRRHHPSLNICYLRMNTPSNNRWYPISDILSNYYLYDPVLLRILDWRLVLPFLHIGFFCHRGLQWLKRKFR